MNDWLKGDGEPESQDMGNHEELIKRELLMLLVIARAIIRDMCSDPEDHKKDVVQRGIIKFLQAEIKRGIRYDTPVNVLRLAVHQEALRHRDLCRREVVVDFNESPDQLKESDTASHASYNPQELAEANSFDPREIYDEMLDLKERLTRVTDLDLFLLYFIEGRTLEEIATQRGWPTMKVQRGVKKLRRELGIHDDEGPPGN